ncbi:MAG: hypothetical protein K0U74_13120 [Alphaproteobacteria bacterium]|nr:hypothetical protein [Alphaproteobacteria bacterium]
MTSEAAYAATKKFWSDLFEECITEVSGAGEWHTIWNFDPREEVQNYARLGGLRPIVSRVSGERARLLMINQIDPGPSAPDDNVPKTFDTALERAPWETGYTNGDVETLRIHLILSDESLPIARDLVKRWIDPSTRYQDMKAKLAALVF